MDILDAGLKTLLTMKLISFEDLDDQTSSQDKRQAGLQPIVFKNGLNQISEQLIKKDDSLIEISFLQKVVQQTDQFIPRNSILSKLWNKNQIAKTFKVNPLFDFCADFDNSQLIQLCIQNENFILANELVQFLLENDHYFETKNNIIMKVLPHLLENSQIEIMKFLSRDNTNDTISKVTLEQTIINKKLPKKGSRKSIYKEIKEQEEDEILDTIKKILPEFSFDSKETEDIEFTYINLFFTSLQMKIDRIQGRETKAAEYIFENKTIDKLNANDLFIARLIQQRKNSKEYYELKTVQKIIGRQFEKFTLVTNQKRFYLYFFCFCGPYFVGILLRNQYGIQIEEKYTPWVVLQICRAIAGFAQVYFFYLEGLEIKWGIKEYFETFVNYVDFSQFFIYFLHLILDCFIIDYKDLSSDGLVIANSYLEVFLVGLATIKLLQLLTSFKEYQMLVVLINQVVINLKPLFVIYVMFIIDFSVMLLVANGSYQLPTSADTSLSTDYPEFPTFFQTLMTTFRFSVGSQVSVQTSISDDLSQTQTRVELALVWCVFIIIQMMLQVVIMNFLIAQISDLYEKIKSGVPDFYKELAEQNFYVLLSIEPEYNQILVIQSPTNYLPSNVDEDDFQTVSTKIKNYQLSQTLTLKNKIKNSQNFLESKFQTLKIIQRRMKTNQDEMKLAQDKIKEKIELAQTEIKHEVSEMKTDLAEMKKNLQAIFELLQKKDA